MQKVLVCGIIHKVPARKRKFHSLIKKFKKKKKLTTKMI